MEPIKLELNLDIDKHLSAFVAYDDDGEPISEPQSFEDVVIGEVARLLLRQIVSSRPDWITSARKRVADIRSEEIRARVIPEIEQIMGQPITRTNTYGEPVKGEPVTLRELIVAEVQKYLTKPVDSYSSNRQTPVQAFISAEVKKAVDAELKDALAKARAEVGEAVKQRAAELLKDSIVGLAAGR